MTQCSIDQCNKKSERRGMCHMHYKRMRLYGSPDLPPKPEVDYEARFWSKVNKTEGCWLWTAGTQHEYGTFWDGKKSVRSHIYSWEMENGKVPAGYELDHKCRNRLCVRPSHLRPLTRAENCQNLGSTGYRGDLPRGVTFHRRSEKFHARVGHRGKMIFAGAYDTPEEAHAAVIQARLRVHEYNEEDR